MEQNLMKKCKWCQKENLQLAKSHIIPRALFNHDGKNDRKIVSLNQHPKRKPIGSYDSNILCADCESNFQQIDSLAAEILLQNFNSYIIPFNDKKDNVAVQINGQHKQEIKRFLIYVLWRASVSTLKEFRNIDLGRHENKIKNELIENVIFATHEYSFAAFKIEKSSGNIYPRKLNKSGFSGCNYYELDFANFIFQIKVDSKTTPEPYKSIAEHEHIVFNKIDETPQKRRQAMIRVIKSAYFNDQHAENASDPKFLR